MINLMQSIPYEKLNSVYNIEAHSVNELLYQAFMRLESVVNLLDNKTDLYGDHKGSWQGLDRPTLSEEGLRAVVEKHIKDIAKLQNDFLELIKNDDLQNNDIIAIKQNLTTINNDLDKINKKLSYYIYVPLPTGGDDTNMIQDCIRSNSVLIFPPNSTYKIRTIKFEGTRSLIIYGNNSKLMFSEKHNEGLVVLNDVLNMKIDFLKFENNFTYESFSFNKHYLIYMNDYSLIEFTNCRFYDFASYAIWIGNAKDTVGTTGGTTSMPFTIHNCFFDWQVINPGGEIHSTAIYLSENAEYGNITNNEFRRVYQAIRGYGANTNIINNTIMDSKAPFGVNNGLIYLMANDNDNSINCGKNIIAFNRINHNTAGATAIYCIGNPNRNERRFTIINNHVLVHGSNDGYAIGIKNADYSLISGNYTQVNTGLKGNILIENSNNVILSNNTMANTVGFRLNNSTAKDDNNSFQNCTQEYYSGDGNGRLLEKTYSFRIKWDGEYSNESNLFKGSCTKTGTGVYTINHGLNHILYIATCTNDNSSTACTFAIRRTATSIEVRVFDSNGNLKDDNFMGVIVTK